MTKKRIGKIKKIIAIVFAVCTIFLSTWGAFAPLNCYAIPNSLVKARTIGELIVTILAGSGTAVTNTPIISGIYGAYDTNAFTFQNLVVEGILESEDTTLTQQEQIDGLGTGMPYNLDYEAFRNYIYGNWQRMIDNGMDQVLRLNDIANSDSVYGAIDNLGQLALSVAENGYLGALNTIALVTNPLQTVQVSFDNIKSAVLDVFGNNIENGMPVNLKLAEGKINMMVTGVDSNGYKLTRQAVGTPNIKGYIGRYTQGYAIGYVSNNTEYLYKTSTNADPLDFNNYLNWSRDGYWSVTNDGGGYVFTGGLWGTAYVPELLYNFEYVGEFSTYNDIMNYLKGINVLNIENGYESPDVINQQQGNITDINNIENAIGNNDGIEIIPSEAYGDFITDTAEEGQQNAAIMADMINDYLYNQPEPTPIVYPTRVPVPTQPAMPDKDPITGEEEESALGNLTPNLEEVFPFCIPYDVTSMMRALSANRTAPEIEWHFESENFGIDYTFTIDLSEFDSVAFVLRQMELILFIVGLAIATRSLIGA